MGRHKTISDDALLAAARQIFVTRGYSASTREIAQIAGISETVLYQRFKTKDTLFYAAMVPSPPDVERMLGPEHPSGDPHAYVRGSVDRMARFFAQCLPLGIQVMMHPGFDAAAFAEAQPARAAEQLERELARRLRRFQQRRLLHSRASTEAAARVLTAIAHDWALRNVLSPPDAQRTRRHLRPAVDAVWQGLAPASSRAGGGR